MTLREEILQILSSEHLLMKSGMNIKLADRLEKMFSNRLKAAIVQGELSADEIAKDD